MPALSSVPTILDSDCGPSKPMQHKLLRLLLVPVAVLTLVAAILGITDGRNPLTGWFDCMI